MLSKEEIKQIEKNVDYLCQVQDVAEMRQDWKKVAEITERLEHELNKLDGNIIQLRTEAVVQ